MTKVLDKLDIPQLRREAVQDAREALREAQSTQEKHEARKQLERALRAAPHGS